MRDELFTGLAGWVVNNSGSDAANCLGFLSFAALLNHHFGPTPGEPVNKSAQFEATSWPAGTYRHLRVVNKSSP